MTYLASEEYAERKACDYGARFSDVSLDDWHVNYICHALVDGVVQGYVDGTFRPNDPIIVRDAAKIVSEVHNIEIDTREGEWYVPYLEAVARERIVPESVERSDQNLSRSEMAQMVWGMTTGNEVTNDKLGQLPEVRSCVELDTQLAKWQKRQRDAHKRYALPEAMMLERSVDFEMAADSAVPEAAHAKTTSSGGESFSETNVQEAGVDEADIVKTDGEYIYLVKEATIRIVKAYPADRTQ